MIYHNLFNYSLTIPLFPVFWCSNNASLKIVVTCAALSVCRVTEPKGLCALMLDHAASSLPQKLYQLFPLPPAVCRRTHVLTLSSSAALSGLLSRSQAIDCTLSGGTLVFHSGEVICEPPNNKLDKFGGTLYWKENKFPLSNQNMLLRGCVLRNTEWCFGLVIFAGEPPRIQGKLGRSWCLSLPSGMWEEAEWVGATRKVKTL